MITLPTSISPFQGDGHALARIPGDQPTGRCPPWAVLLWPLRPHGLRQSAVRQRRRTVAPADAAGCRVYEEGILRAMISHAQITLKTSCRP